MTSTELLTPKYPVADTILKYYTVNIVGNTVPTGTRTVSEKSNLIITHIGNAKPIVIDNNIDVTSQVIESSTGSTIYVPSNYAVDGFTAINMSNAYNSSSNTDSYATLEIDQNVGICYFDIPINLPANAVIQSVACSAALQFDNNNSSSDFTSSIQMYAGDVAKGSITTWAKNAVNISRTTYNLTVGNWTVSELKNAKFCLTATNNASVNRFINIYGISFIVTYTINGKVYTYVLNNITTDHTITFIASTDQPIVYIKLNNKWIQSTGIYKKINGVWQEIDPNQAFENDINYYYSS